MKLSGISINIPKTDKMIAELEVTNNMLKESLRIITDTAAKKMANWAKENAIWTDRTANARQRMSGKGYWEDNHTLVCAVMHNVDYGIWLELAHAKKFAILEQAIESQKNDLIKQYCKLI